VGVRPFVFSGNGSAVFIYSIDKFIECSSPFGRQVTRKKEADYAQELDLLVKVGEIKSWERQVPIELRVNGKKICTYTMDFITITKEGHEKWIEVKGFETPEWRLKWKLLDALFPDQDKEVVK
jgi:hypothetical protein